MLGGKVSPRLQRAFLWQMLHLEQPPSLSHPDSAPCHSGGKGWSGMNPDGCADVTHTCSPDGVPSFPHGNRTVRRGRRPRKRSLYREVPVGLTEEQPQKGRVQERVP